MQDLKDQLRIGRPHKNAPNADGTFRIWALVVPHPPTARI